MSTKKIIIYAVLALLGFVFIGNVISTACSSSAVKQFKKALEDGNLSEASKYIEQIDDSSDKERCALRLIRVYLELDNPKQAIYVYEVLTPYHEGRDNISYSFNTYERDACKLLRDYLVKHGDYETAWNYYPLKALDENYIGNAPCLYDYMNDVVVAMCAAGRQDEASQFVRSKLSWFATYVDASSSQYASEYAAFQSNQVRERLEQLIDESYNY